MNLMSKSRKTLFEHGLFLLPAILIGWLAFTIYFLTQPSPTDTYAFYAVHAEQIISNGFIYPQSVPYYTVDGLPFAYPPLMLYLLAIVHHLFGITYESLAWFLPAAYFPFLVGGYYVLSLELLPSRKHAALSTIILVATPATFNHQLYADGLATSLIQGVLFVGLFTGYRLFTKSDTRWLLPSGILFGVTLLSHPPTAQFFGLSYLVMYGYFDRTYRGLLHGAAVAGIGFLCALPWVLVVVDNHGVDPFITVINTGLSGKGGGILFLSNLLTALNLSWNTVASSTVGIWFLVPLAGFWYVAEGDYFLPIWALVATVVYVPTFGYYIQVILVAGFLLNGLRKVYSSGSSGVFGHFSGEVLLILIIIFGTVVTMGFAGLSSPNLTDSDREAMHWIESNTPEDATFVMLTSYGTSDSLPLYAERTLLMTPLGVEWVSENRFQTNTAFYRDFRSCSTGDCVRVTLNEYGVSPDYTYIDKDRVQASTVTDEYEVVFENSGVLIVSN
jgi:hypothetical protein